MSTTNSDARLRALPQGWVWATLGEVSDTTRKRARSQHSRDLIRAHSSPLRPYQLGASFRTAVCAK